MEEKNKDKNLQDQLKNCEEKCEEYLNGWKRERADFLNYKKEEMERIGNLAKYANEELVLNFMPILDNIGLAEMHLQDEGISQIKKQFLDLLKKEGIEPIETIGKQFNPNLMEVMEEIESKDAESGIVTEEMQKGYTMHGKLIRPARVRVTK